MLTNERPTGLDLKLARIALRVRCADVAAAAGWSRQRVSAIEWRRRPVSEQVAAKYLDALARCRS